MTQKPGEYNIFVIIGATGNCTKITSCIYLGHETFWLGWVKRSEIKITAGDDPENRVSAISW